MLEAILPIHVRIQELVDYAERPILRRLTNALERDNECYITVGQRLKAVERFSTRRARRHYLNEQRLSGPSTSAPKGRDWGAKPTAPKAFLNGANGWPAKV